MNGYYLEQRIGNHRIFGRAARVIGAHKRPLFRVRRSDFSSQKNYELALKAAMAEARFTTAPPEEKIVIPTPKPQKKIVVKPKVTDTQIELKPADQVLLQKIADDPAEELKLIEFIINLIESEDL